MTRYALVAIALSGGCRHSAPPDSMAVTTAAGVGVGADASAGAGADASAGASAGAGAGAGAGPDPPPGPSPSSATIVSPSPSPFGPPLPIARYTCPNLLRGGSFRSYLAAADTKVAFVDGDDRLALVNRSPPGALAPSYAPSDLVDLATGVDRPAAACETAHDCLRKDAATALRRMLGAMRQDGLKGRVESAFRGFATQCWVFANWADKARGGFCEATAQSALPGHSQHQLGTTIDLFTEEWAQKGGVFRNGFGCTPGGRWLDEHAWRFGFVVPYPIDPDDRKDGSRCATRADRNVPIDPKTGYKHEPWHLRFIGDDDATRYHEAWLKSGPGSPQEITLEQWLRVQRGLVGDGELPVCDGCQCGACATMADDDERTPCGPASLQLDGNGRVRAPAQPPTLLAADASRAAEGLVDVDVTLRVPAHSPTQPPVTGRDGPTYVEGATYLALEPYPDSRPHAYPDLPGAWRVGVEPVPPDDTRWPWRASLAAADLAATWNRANLLLPGKAGDAVKVRLRISPPRGAKRFKVALLRDDVERDAREVPLP